MTTVEVDGDRAVVVKRSPAHAVEQLRREGERLRRASHPGVVEVLRSAPAGDGWELRTAHAGRPLAILDARTVPQVAAVVAAVASTLADLHALGIVHGRLDPSHVLVGEQGRPVLCGFGEGPGEARPEDDVAALGRLLTALVAREEDAEPIPERRWLARRTWSGWDRRALLLLADQACAEPATRRPTARRLAAAIAEAVPDAVRIDGSPTESEPHPDTGPVDPIEQLRATSTTDVHERSSRSTRTTLAIVGAALLVVVAGLRLRDGSSGSSPKVVDEVSSATSSTSSTLASVRTARPVPGSVLTVGGRRYRVGQAGDELLVDDWDCNGSSTPALLRPDTGEVFVFRTWADHARLEVEPVVQVAGAQALVSGRTAGSACPSLLVRTASGDVPVRDTVSR